MSLSSLISKLRLWYWTRKCERLEQEIAALEARRPSANTIHDPWGNAWDRDDLLW